MEAVYESRRHVYKKNKMNLYIPEIGDHLLLIEDWKFKLHAENRNQDLGEFFGHYLMGYNAGWIEESKLPRMRNIDYQVKYPSDEELDKQYGGFMKRVTYDQKQKSQKEAEQACPEFVQYWKDNDIWNQKAKKIAVKELEVTIPAGTILAVDRIYIRKGASDYSSITFYAKELGEVMVQGRRWFGTSKPKKKKALRFWAKLEDCNKIKFERTEKI
jgi:hypothetical protein